MTFLLPGLFRVPSPAGHPDGQTQAGRDPRPGEGRQDPARGLELWEDQVLHAPARDLGVQPRRRDCLTVRHRIQGRREHN